LKRNKIKTGTATESDPNNEVTLISPAFKAVTVAEKMGASQVEIYALRKIISTCSIEKLEVTFAQRKVQSGVGIRVALGKKVGFSCTSNASEQSIRESIEKAIRIARARDEDSRFKSFPSKGKYQKVSSILDKKVKEAQIEDLIDRGRSLAETMRTYDKRIQSGSGMLTYIAYNRAIANSLGLDLEENDTVVNAQVSSMAKEDGDVSGVDYLQLARYADDVDIEELGKTVSRLTVEQLHRKPIQTKTIDLVLHSYAVGDLLTHTLHPAFLGDNLDRNRTPFAGKMSEKVASELISIEDNGILEKGYYSQSFDDEGAARRNTSLIRKGVVESFLYDSLWAGKANTESTGNSVRKDATSPKTYSSEPVIDTTNIVVKAGDRDFDQLVSEVDEGILVYSLIGAHTSNAASGAFSVAGQTVFRIEHGEIVYPVKESMIGGSLTQLLSQVSAVANDVKTYENGLRHRVTISPSIRFSDVKVSA
jgi:PmbA protein